MQITLDEQQRAAVETDAPRVLCLAGAGAGKTRVIVERIALLLGKCSVSPYEITAFTFTRKAAAELRDRIAQRLEDQKGRAAQIRISTIHSFCLDMLQRFGDKIGLPRSPAMTIYDEWEEAYLVKQIARELKIYNGKAWNPRKRDIDEVFAKYYQEGILPIPDDGEAAFTLFQETIRRCKENNALTYGSIVVGAAMLMPKIVQYLPRGHVFLDEAQDTDAIQWNLINTLCAVGRNNLFAVGDIDQSIYSFRGARPQYLIDNEQDFAIYRLENNYRSDPVIVKAANNLISHNTQRLPKTMHATKPSIGPAAIYRINNADSMVMAKEIKRDLFHVITAQQGDKAVLCRVHTLLKKLSEILTTEGVKHKYVGKNSDIVHSEQFRKLVSFLKLKINPYDNFAFLLVKDLCGISDSDYKRIRLLATQQGKSHFQAYLDEWQSSAHMVFRAYNDLSDLDSVINTINHYFEFPEEFKNIFEFYKENYPISPYNKNANTETTAYLAYIATFDIQDELQASQRDAPGLRLMTVHAAKGLEFQNVYVLGMNNGIMPHKRALDGDEDELEEERRCAYVAITRAIGSLNLCVRPEFTKNPETGKEYINPESMFVREINEPQKG